MAGTRKYIFVVLLLLLAGVFAMSVPGGNTASHEPVCDDFGIEEPVEIVGYDGQAMEPCITPDGAYLLFNNRNGLKDDTHIHLARREGKGVFRYLGLLRGTVSPAKDMAPSVDSAGRIYFTSLRTYEDDMRSLFVGQFDGGSVRGVLPVAGDISPAFVTWINMDCCVSEDGKSLLVSRARFDIGKSVPAESDLLLCTVGDGKFKLDTRSSQWLAKVNTKELEYAPSLSGDGKELYFSRSRILMSGNNVRGAHMRVMVAKRQSVDRPFGEPRVISTISGFSEAPTLPHSMDEIFFHKLAGDKFVIRRVERKRERHET